MLCTATTPYLRYPGPGDAAEPDSAEPAPEVSEQQAVDNVVACLEDRQPMAYGDTSREWREWLIDYIIDKSDQATMILMLLGKAGGTSPARHLTQGLERYIQIRAQQLVDAGAPH